MTTDQDNSYSGKLLDSIKYLNHQYESFNEANFCGLEEDNYIMNFTVSITFDNYFSLKNANGHWKYYYPSGQVESEGMYKNGKRNGVWKYYHPNGSNYYKLKYIDDVKSDGEINKYNQNNIHYKENNNR